MSGTRKKVLWADDEIEFLRAHIMFLETRGYNVTPVFSGHDAIHLVAKDPGAFDIVLLDEQMPGKDGLTTLEEIKTIAPDLPVVMVTKSEEEHLMDAALGRKIDGYLTKPVNPSQILMVCKRLLDSKQIISKQISQMFIQNFSENKMQLSTQMDAKNWIRLYENLTKWDIDLEKSDNEGLRQAHAGQKSDCNTAFAQFIEENYLGWLRNPTQGPVLSHQVVNRYLAPLVNKGKKIYFVVLKCMRLDQYLGIEALLKKYFEIDRSYYYSIIPSSSPHTTAALFGGQFPADIAKGNTAEWASLVKPKNNKDCPEQVLLTKNLKECGVLQTKLVAFERIHAAADARAILARLDDFKDDPLVSIVVDFMGMLTQSRATSTIIQEIAPDETAFRALTSSWFQFSTVFALLKKLATKDCTVVLTTDHGSVFCTRGTEVYGSKDLPKDLRYMCGKSLTTDDRMAMHISDPSIFHLPLMSQGPECIVAKENFFFVLPGKFENLKKQYQNSFQHGGVSMEEMIVPWAVLRPKTQEE